MAYVRGKRLILRGLKTGLPCAWHPIDLNRLAATIFATGAASPQAVCLDLRPRRLATAQPSSSEKGKGRPDGRPSSDFPSIFRIPGPAAKPANFLQPFWRGSLAFAAIITFVRAAHP